MSGQQYGGGYYGPDYRSQKQPAGRNPYRASTGNAASLYGGGGGNGGYGANGHYRDTSDDWSSTYYGDDFTDDSVSEDFQHLSLGQRGGHQSRFDSYAAGVAAGRNPGHRGYTQSQRPPSPTDSSFSQTTASQSTAPYGTKAHAHHAAQFHAHKRIPSKSLDRFSHYLPKGYRFAGPYRGEEDNVEPEYRGEEDRSRGVMVPARSMPRNKSMRRGSSPETRGREQGMRKGPQYYSQSERKGPQYYSQSERQQQQQGLYHRSVSQDRHQGGRSHHRGQALVRRSSSIGRFETTLSQAENNENAAPSGALVRRSKSVGAREAWRRRRSLGNINPEQHSYEPKNPGGTAVRLDLGGRDVDINVNDREKRRGPTIGSITINQNGPKGEVGAGAPSESGRTRTTALTEREWEDRARRFFGDNISSPPTSPESDEFARMERKFNMRQQRQRSASLGTALPHRRKIPLQIGAPPAAGQAVPPTPGGEPKHTRISRKIVTRQALEELSYEYEDTGDTFTVFEILSPEQIDQLMDMTARIRAARHDRRRARSRGERQSQYAAEFRFEDYQPRKAGQAPLRPVVNQEQKPYGYRERDPPMPGSWPAQPPPQPRNLPMPDHTRFQRPGPGNLGGPPGQKEIAPARYGRGDGTRYWR